MELIGVGFLSAIGLFILMWKINLELFAKYHWQTDIIVSSMLMLMFYGTFSGMVTALIAGIFISVFLFTARLIIDPL